ncbi:MAG: SET domain-containing protein-lysine N-methyltransferase [Verrucomicrobia bacterium]|nr:SET domain-containing protein-lysine N-methyltransferase [Verrucomicrobiota bacterium]
MYLIPTVVKKSVIEGSGVFADADIGDGEIVWKFSPINDLTMTTEDYDGLDEAGQAEIRKVGYVSPASGQWVYPPVGDAARYTNHSETNNNLTAVFDVAVSDEPFFVARRDIIRSEELIVNYVEFDASIKKMKPEWMSTNT